MANYYSYNTNQVQADINMDNAIKDIQNQLLNIPTDTQLGLKANQTDLDTTNANVAANTSSLADIATFATSNGINDNTSFVNMVTNSNKIYIAPGVVLKLGYTSTNTYISLNNPIEIYGGGTIEFIGDFTQSDLFKVGGNNVYIHDVHFINNTATYTTYAKGFISTLTNVDHLRLENCTFTNGAIITNQTTNANIKNNVLTNGFILGFGGSNNRITYNSISIPPTSSLANATGISFSDTNTSVGSNNYIANNVITNVNYSGISLYHYHSNTVIENNVVNCVGAAVVNTLIPISLATVNDITVRNNIVTTTNASGTYYGIESADSSNVLITGNRVSGFLGGIMVNGTATTLSFNNIVENNFIENFTVYGIHLLRYTQSNIVKNNVITSNAVDNSQTNYGISMDADSKNEFSYNQIFNNKILIDTSSLPSVVGIRGIYAYSTRNKYKDNIIVIKSPQNAIGLYMFCGDNYGMNYGRNTDITGNEITLTVNTINSSTYGIQINHTGTNDNLNNTQIQYNRINTVAPTGSTTWVSSTPYALNANVIPITVNGYYYTCTTAGTSGATEPTWTTTQGGTVLDGTVTWTCHGNQQLSYNTSKVGNGTVANNYTV